MMKNIKYLKNSIIINTQTIRYEKSISKMAIRRKYLNQNVNDFFGQNRKKNV